MALSALAARISSAAVLIDKHLESANLPNPSFAASSPSLPNDPAIASAKLELQAVLEELTLLTSGPDDLLAGTLLGNVHDLSTYRVFNQFNFWDAVPLDGSASYAEIAERTGLYEERVRRFLRHGSTRRLFARTADGRVQHTNLSAYFVKKPLARSWLSHITEETLPAVTKVVEALEKYGGSGEPGDSAAGLALWKGREDMDAKDIFGFLASDGEGEKKGYRVKRFGEAMAHVAGNEAFNIKTIHVLYDWGRIGKGPFVDIGGSTGHVAIELAKTYPSLGCIVEDLPEVSKAFAEGVPSDLSGRLSFKAHDFFKPQPVDGAAVYFMKHILHDWSDKYATKILDAIVPALTKPGARIILMEGIVPEGDEAPWVAKRIMTGLDLAMMVVNNSKERTVQDWQDLVAGTDGNLELKEIHSAPGCAFSLIEIGKKD